jgi:hypothetical protein
MSSVSICSYCPPKRRSNRRVLIPRNPVGSARRNSTTHSSPPPSTFYSCYEKRTTSAAQWQHPSEGLGFFIRRSSHRPSQIVFCELFFANAPEDSCRAAALGCPATQKPGCLRGFLHWRQVFSAVENRERPEPRKAKQGVASEREDSDLPNSQAMGRHCDLASLISDSFLAHTQNCWRLDCRRSHFFSRPRGPGLPAPTGQETLPSRLAKERGSKFRGRRQSV